LPPSGGDRKALKKELARSQGVTLMLAQQSEVLRAKGEQMVQADDLSCQSWTNGSEVPASRSTRPSTAGIRAPLLDW
jgi:hypothetical protein